LRARPDERHASVDALVTALSRSSVRRRWWLLAPVVAILGLGVAWFAMRDRSEPCAGADRRVARVWNDTRRAGVVASLTKQAPHGAEVGTRVASLVDTYARQWAVGQTEACRDTRVRGVYSDRVLDARTACFDSHLEHLRALLGVLDESGANVVDEAVSAVHALPPLVACNDVAALTAATPLPTDPAAAADVEAIHADLARVRALASSGRHADARDLART